MRHKNHINRHRSAHRAITTVTADGEKRKNKQKENKRATLVSNHTSDSCIVFIERYKVQL